MKTVQIIGKEWLDKVNGNSYFSARVYIDNELVKVLPFQYGYGSHFEHAGLEAINTDWHTLRDQGVNLLTTMEENCKQRDVKKWGTDKWN